MANRYVDSNAVGAANGTTWADAFTTIAAADAVDAAGDVIYVAQDHVENQGSAISWGGWAGTSASPTRIICADKTSGAPPATLATTASISTTGDFGIAVDSNTGTHYTYWYGIQFHAGLTSAATCDINLTNNSGRHIFEKCGLDLASSGASSRINFNSASANTGSTECYDCDFQFSAAGQAWNTSAGSGNVIVRGGSVLSDAAITNIAGLGNAHTTALIEGMDLSNCASTLNIFNSNAQNQHGIIRNCKLPASWSGSVNGSTPGPGSVHELINCDAGDTHYKYQRKAHYGTIDSETTIVRSGGASDGTTPISWKMVSGADAEWKHQTLDSPEMAVWNATVGSAITATAEIIHSGVGSGGAGDFTDREVWLDVQYLGTSGFPRSLFVNDGAATFATAAADQDNSAVTWTSEPATPDKQKLAVTFTPQEAGWIIAKVRCAFASKTFYVDPKITIS